MALHRELADPNGISLACEFLADTVMYAGDLQRAKSLIVEADLTLRQVQPDGIRGGVDFTHIEILCWIGEYDKARRLMERLFDNDRRTVSEGATAGSKLGHGYFLCLLGQYLEGKGLIEQGLQIFKDSNTNRHEFNYQQIFIRELSHALGCLGDYKQARRWIDDYQHLFQLPYYQPGFLALRGFLDLQEGNIQSAYSHYQESLRVAHRMEYRLLALLALEGCAWAFAYDGQATRSANLLGAAAEFRERTGAKVYPRDRPLYDKVVAGMKRPLGEEKFDITWQEGYRVGIEETIKRVIP